MLYFGGIDALSQMIKKIESDYPEEMIPLSVLPEFYDKKKKEIMKALNQHADVSNVSDLFTQPDSPVQFNPIMADMRIPFPLQKRDYGQKEREKSKVEKFKVIYDGYVLFVAALCPINERCSGVYDVRDRFEEILKPICKFKELAPCLTHQAIIFVRKGDRITRNTADLYVEVSLSSSVLDLVRNLYLSLGQAMQSFYSLCSLTYFIENSVSEIREHESKLLSILKTFLNTDWKSVRKRGSLIKQGKQKMLEILEGLSDYANLTSMHLESRKEFEEKMKHNTLLNKFIKKIDLDEYAKPQSTQDTDSSMRIVEHVRRELETYSISKSTMISALLGAIIGSVLTLLAATILGYIGAV